MRPISDYAVYSFKEGESIENGARLNVLNVYFRLREENPQDSINQVDVCCCYISALELTCFCLTGGCAMFFQIERIAVSFMHLMVLLFKVIFNHTSKRQFAVLHFYKINNVKDLLIQGFKKKKKN